MAWGYLFITVDLVQTVVIVRSVGLRVGAAYVHAAGTVSCRSISPKAKAAGPHAQRCCQ